jgi:hypothetical protein
MVGASAPLLAGRPPILPSAGSSSFLEFAWILPPDFSVEFTCRVNVPLRQVGTRKMQGQITYRLADQPNTAFVSPLLSTAPEPALPPRTFYVDPSGGEGADGLLTAPFPVI